MAITYDSIASQTLDSAVTSVTFSGIPSTYTDLVLVTSGNTAVNSNTYLQFNGDTSTLYSITRMSSNGSATSARTTGATKINLDAFGFYTVAVTANKIISIQNYSNTTTFKSVLARANSSSGGDGIVGLYRSTAAITSLTFTSDSAMQIGSTFSLYGIKAA
jgi:hypothetical protein